MSKIRVFVVETDVQEKTMLDAIQRLVLLVSQKSRPAPLPRRMQADPWIGKIQQFILGRPETTHEEILAKCLELPVQSRTQSDMNRIAAILRNAGWRAVKTRDGQVRKKVYRPHTLDARARVRVAAGRKGNPKTKRVARDARRTVKGR